MARQPVRVQIFNQTYTVLAEEPGEVQQLAQQIDDLMVSIAARAGTADSTRVAVLACLHLADKLRTAERQVEEFSSKSDAISAMLEATLETT